MTTTRALVVVWLAVVGRRRAPPMKRTAIGAACTSDSVCGIGPTFYCAIDRPGGYCEAGCNNDRDSPPEAVCVVGRPFADTLGDPARVREVNGVSSRSQ